MDRQPVQAAWGSVDGRGGGRAARTAALLAVPCLAILGVLALRSPTGSDARYVEAAREMLETRDFVVPHLGYVPYFEKPVLLYWLAAAAQAAFGLSPLVARLPSILATTGSVLVTHAIGRELGGPRLGAAGALVFLSLAIVPLTGGVLLTDPPFALFLTLAAYAFLRHERAPGSWWIWLSWAALGLATLTKGPLALVLAGASAGSYFLLLRRPRDLLGLRPLRGLCVVVAVNAPWWILVGGRDPRFVEFFFVRQNLRAFFDGTVNHAAGPWYYFATLPPSLFPWTILAVAAVAVPAWQEGVRAWRLLTAGDAAAPADRGRTFLVTCVVPPLLFLTVSGSKLWYYALPLCPAIALLVADYVARRAERPGRFLRGVTFAHAALLAAGLAVAAALRVGATDARYRLDPAYAPAVWTIAVAALLGVTAGGFAAWRGRLVLGFSIAAVSTTLALPALSLVLERALVGADAGDLAARVAAVRQGGERVVVSSKFVEDYKVQFVLRGRVGVVGRARELGMGMFCEVTPTTRPLPDDPYEVNGRTLPENPWIYDMPRLAAEWAGPQRMWLIASSDPREEAARTLAGIRGVEFCRDPSRVVLTNHPLPR